MNPANHGQCHIRRNSRDERVQNEQSASTPQQQQQREGQEECGGGPQAAGEGQVVVSRPQAAGQGQVEVSRPQSAGQGQVEVSRPQAAGQGQVVVSRPQAAGQGQVEVSQYCTRPQAAGQGQEQVSRPQTAGEEVSRSQTAGEGQVEVSRPQTAGDGQMSRPQTVGEGQVEVSRSQAPSEELSLPQATGEGQEEVSRPQATYEGQEEVTRPQAAGEGQEEVSRPQTAGEDQEEVSRPQTAGEGQEEVSRPQTAGEGQEEVSRPQEWPAEAGQGPRTPRVKARGRSGSWSGVNESDDELEKMAQVYNEPPPDIKVSPAMHNGGSHYGSVTSSIGSVGDYGHLDDSTTTNTTNGLFNPEVTADRMRRRLKFFFMNPMEKWHARRRFPWKLLLQIFKIVVVTAQLCLFAQQGYNHVNYLWDTKVSFSHLFIKGWDTSREIQAYPPSAGPLAVYKKSVFYEYLDYAVLAYVDIPEEAIGTYTYHHRNGSIVPPVLCATHYASGQAFTVNNSYVLDDNVTKTCIKIPPSDVNVTGWSTKAYLEQHNFVFDFDLLLQADFTFVLQTIKLRVNLPFDTPECYRLTGRVDFDNSDHDGQILVDLDVSARVLECAGSIEMASEARILKVWRTIINIVSISICFTSLCMCVRAIYRAQILKKATVLFFHRHYGRELTLDERMEFVNLWYVLICVNDILIILGSFLKIGLETKLFLEEEERSYEGYLDTWNVCSLFLGLGNLLVWFGCLRYLGFFTTYNVLILTIKKCIPNVLRFSICIMMVFAGYCLCGWLVLGPYNLKFRSLSSTMECLYSLINGDDMFATFSSTTGKDPLVWWFSRIYLYTFISLFIYVILSLFIAIIMDAYETIKNCYEDGFPLSNLMKFVNECTEEPTSGVFRDVGDRTIHDIINSLCCCGHERHQNNAEYEPLLT